MRRTFLSSGLIQRLVIMGLSTTLAATLAVAAFTSTGAAQVNVFREGFSHGGSAIREFPYNGTPLLKTFNFQFVPKYEKCVPEVTGDCFGQVDHNINGISANPHYYFPQGASPYSRLVTSFTDKGFDDPFYYDVQHYFEFDPSLNAHRDSISASGAVGDAKRTIYRPTPASDFVFVLTGFELSFNRNDSCSVPFGPAVDHYIEQVGIIENDRQVTIDFSDWNEDDCFEYIVRYIWVPRDMFSTLGESSSLFARDHDQKTIPPGPAVIRGFHFNFIPLCIGSTTCSDHPLKKIGVLNQGGRLQVRYADKNGDDPFQWRVKWGILK